MNLVVGCFLVMGACALLGLLDDVNRGMYAIVLALSIVGVWVSWGTFS